MADTDRGRGASGSGSVRVSACAQAGPESVRPRWRLVDGRSRLVRRVGGRRADARVPEVPPAGTRQRSVLSELRPSSGVGLTRSPLRWVAIQVPRLRIGGLARPEPPLRLRPASSRSSGQAPGRPPRPRLFRRRRRRRRLPRRVRRRHPRPLAGRSSSPITTSGTHLQAGGEPRSTCLSSAAMTAGIGPWSPSTSPRRAPPASMG